LSGARFFITSMGIISPVGQGVQSTLDAIRNARPGIKLLTLFPSLHTPSLPVGEIDAFSFADNVPRTHALALIAAEEAMQQADGVPDAVVIGVTTGGMLVTEELLKRDEDDAKGYEYHSTASVAEYVARHVRCRGPVLTLSTACSSSSVALKIALEMLRNGQAQRVLAGGADSLCRLTYYGFHSLQLVDKTGAHPFDKARRGMSVGEGAAMLLLTAAETPPDNAIAELLGVGLSCDAYHPAAPQPEGVGALLAMKNALADAHIAPADIDYIHLHGTGTLDNDLAEAKAIHNLFEKLPIPLLSSIKGAFGHSLAAAGAVGAVVSALSIAHSIIPANTGFRLPDPALDLIPVDVPKRTAVNVVLANSFGFGGNNAVLVVSHPKWRKRTEKPLGGNGPAVFSVLGAASLTIAGGTEQAIARLMQGTDLKGTVPGADILQPLSEKSVRRLKRFPRMVLSLALSACKNSATAVPPASIFLGTGWGGLSETYDFLTKLFSSDERFTSPTDFIGSVHNAAAGHVAIHFQATGPNVTTTGGNYAFEQALLSASMLARNGDSPLLVIGADEHHETLSPRFDPSSALAGPPSDGGGAMYLIPATASSPWRISPSFLTYAGNNDQVVSELIQRLGGKTRIREQFGIILAGIPAAYQALGTKQLDAFLSMTAYPHPVVDYRRYLGEFASASAVATIIGLSFVQAGVVPVNICHQQEVSLEGRGVLVLGFGLYATAVEILP